MKTITTWNLRNGNLATANATINIFTCRKQMISLFKVLLDRTDLEVILEQVTIPCLQSQLPQV